MRVACLRKSLHRRSSLPKTASSLWRHYSSSFRSYRSLLLMTGCGGASLAVNLNTIAAIGAPASSVRVNQTVQLTSSYLASGLPMTFSVNGIPGGNAQVGTISSTGLYTAPAVVPNSLHGHDHQLHRQVSNRSSRLSSHPGVEPHSRPQRSHSERFLRGHDDRHGQRFAVCLRSADQLERRPRSHHLCLQHAIGGANRRAEPRHFPAHGHQSRSRIGQRHSAFHEGGSRPRRAYA